MKDVDAAKRARLLLAIFLLASALGLGGFHALLFQHDNAAPVVDLAGYRTEAAGFRYRMEKCRSNGRKLAAIGWIVREGRDQSRRTVRVVLVEDEGGRARALKTTLVDREDVSRDLNRQLGDVIRYRNAGFTASLDVTAADPPLRPGTLHVAYDDGDRKVLLPIPCRMERPR